MDKSAVADTVARFKRALEARGIRGARFVLFGSYATGVAHEGSDIDLVVISPDFDGKGYWERIRVLSDAIYDVFEPIEATALTPEEWDRGGSQIADYARDGEVM